MLNGFTKKILKFHSNATLMEFRHYKDEEKATNAHLLNRYLTTQLLKYINKSFNIFAVTKSRTMNNKTLI